MASHGNRRRDGTEEGSIHLLRHSLHKLGKTTEEIAKMHGVKEQSVRKSIGIVDAYRLANTLDVMNTSVIGVVIGRKKKIAAALDDALGATVIGKGGDAVPNHDVRLKAVGEYRQLVQSVQPKGGGSKSATTVLVNQQTGVHTAPPSSESQFTGFEERIRKIRVQVDQHNQLPPPPSVAAPMGEDEIDVGEEDEASVEPQHTSG